MQEIKRCFNIRFIAALVVLLFVNVCIIKNTYHDDDGVYAVYDELVRRTAAYSDGNQASFGESASNAVQAYFDAHGLPTKGPYENVTDELIVANTARELLMSAADYADGFKDELLSRRTTAEKILSSGLYKKSSFEYHNLVKTIKDIDKTASADIKMSNGVWLEKLMQYEYIHIFVLCLVFILIYEFFSEKKNGLYQIIHASRHGRIHLYVKRCFILAVGSLIINFLFYFVSAIILLNIYGGYEGLNAAACFDKSMFLTTGTMTRLQFVVNMALTGTIFSVALGAIFWYVLSFFKNFNIGIFVFIIVCAVGVLLHILIPSKSFVRLFYYVNLYYLFFPMKTLAYHNWGYFGMIVNLPASTRILSAVIIALFMYLNGYKYVKQYYTGRSNRLELFIIRCGEKVMSISAGVPAFFKELYKLLVSQKVAVIFIILIYMVGRLNVGPEVLYEIFTSYMSGYYEAAKGLQYGDELEKVYDEYLNDYNVTIAGLDMNKPNEANIYNYRTSAINAIRSNIDYLKEQADKGNKAVVVKPYEYVAAFRTNETGNWKMLCLMNVLMAIVVFCCFMPYEKKSEVYRIANSYKNRKQWLIKKILAGVTVVFAFGVASYSVYIHKLIKVYKLAQFDAPIKSLDMFKDFIVNPPIIVFLVGYIIILLTGSCCLGIIVSRLTARLSPGQSYVAGLSVMLPQLLYLLGFKQLEKISVVKYFSFFQCYFETGASLTISMVVYALVVAVGLSIVVRMAAGKKKW